MNAADLERAHYEDLYGPGREVVIPAGAERSVNLALGTYGWLVLSGSIVVRTSPAAAPLGAVTAEDAPFSAAATVLGLSAVRGMEHFSLREVTGAAGAIVRIWGADEVTARAAPPVFA